MIERRPFPFVVTANLVMKLQLVRVKDSRLIHMLPVSFTAKSGKFYPDRSPIQRRAITADRPFRQVPT